MFLIGTEHQGLLALIDVAHEELYPIAFALGDDDFAIEVFFQIGLAALDFAFEEIIIGGVYVFVDGGGELLDLERGQETVIDAVLEAVDIDWRAKVRIGIHVVPSLGGGGEAQLYRRRKVFEDAPPAAFVLGAAPMTFIHHDEVEEVWRIVPKVRCFTGAAHEGLENAEKDTAVGGDAAFLADILRGYPHQGIFGESVEGIESLIGEDIPVRKKKNTWPAAGFAGDAPAGLKKLPGDLEGDEGFAGAGSQRQEDALLSLRNSFQNALYGGLLIVAGLE